MAAGISNDGERVEVEFRRLTEFRKPTPARLGDAELTLDGQTKYVEVKKASSDTLNQVRPVKYSTLVAKDVRDGQWYVVPPQVVVAEAIDKGRGQHSESPFECCTLSLGKLLAYRTPVGKLRDAVVEATRSGDALDGLPEVLRSHIERIRKVVEEDRARIREALPRS